MVADILLYAVCMQNEAIANPSTTGTQETAESESGAFL